MKNKFNFFGIIALAAVIVFSMAACGDGSDNDSGSPSVKTPSLSGLPNFPSSSSPAASKSVAEQVLEDLQNSLALREVRRDIEDYIDDYVYDELDGDWDKNFSFSNKAIPGAKLKLTASQKSSESLTGGFKALSNLSLDPDDFDDWEDYEDAYDALWTQINFSSNDKSKVPYQVKSKGEITSDKTIGNVTIASGSTFESLETGEYSGSVTKPGTTVTALFNLSYSVKDELAIGCTVTTPSGSVKIILSVSISYKGWKKDCTIIDWITGPHYSGTDEYSGSLKVYGENNALLINHPVNKWDDYKTALTMIGYWDWDDYYSYSSDSSISIEPDNSSARTAIFGKAHGSQAASHKTRFFGPKQ